MLLGVREEMTEQRQDPRINKLAFCEEKQRLIGVFVDSSHDFMELHNQQTQAVIDGDSDFARFDDLIHMARERKDKAKYALIAHLEEHSC